MDPSPFVRTSFWTVSIGLTALWVSHLGVSPTCIQRFLAVPNIKFARKSVWVFVVGLVFIKGASCLVGIIMYAYYEKCDPVTTKQIEKVDQILPFFIMQVASKIPGLPGIFIAGIFSAALSSLSTGLNTLSGTIYEDFIRPFNPNATEKRASDIMKILVVVLGLIIVSLVFVVEHMGQVFAVNMAVSGITAGSLLGLFTIGMVSRYVNTKGVICGALAGVIVVLFIVIGAQSLPKHTPLPVRVDGCDFPINITLASSSTSSSAVDEFDDNPMIFKLSFMYYCILGTIVLSVVAYIVSWLTGGCEPFDERLLAPFMRSENYVKAKIDDDAVVRKNHDTLYNDLDCALKELKKAKRYSPRASIDAAFFNKSS
jgi:Na+/proline symporter